MTNVDIWLMTNVNMVNDRCIRDLWDICTSLGAVNDKCRHMVNDKCKHGQWTQQKLAGCDLDLMPFCQLHVSLTGCKIFTIVIDWVYTIYGYSALKI